MTALQVHNIIRALAPPYPSAFTYNNADQLYFTKSKLLQEEIRGVPGRVALCRKNGLVVVAKDRGVLIERLRLEGEESEREATEFFHLRGTTLGKT